MGYFLGVLDKLIMMLPAFLLGLCIGKSALEQEPCEKGMNKAYQFGKNKIGVYWNKQTDTVELPKAVFENILRQVPTE